MIQHGRAFDLLTQSPCLGVHLDFMPGAAPEGFDSSTLDDFDQKCEKKSLTWDKGETAYLQEHATKTATIGAVCESSPVPLLAW